MRRLLLCVSHVATPTAVAATAQARVTAHNEAKNAPAPPTVSVFATGFNNPRGLEWGPDGNLYVAEGGLGGQDSTVGRCTQVDPPVGPYTGSTNDAVNGGRISKVTPAGVRTTLASGLPSSMTGDESGSLVSGLVPGTGTLVRVRAGRVAETIASGTTFPTGLTVGPDGAFYVSDQGFGFPAGQGQVLRITTG